MKNNQEQLAYLAGIIDGEGSFSIDCNIGTYFSKRKNRNVFYPYFATRVSVSLKHGNEKVLPLLVKSLKGTICRKGIDGSTKSWNLNRIDDLLVAVPLLIPYLKIKQEIASNFLIALRLSKNKFAKRWPKDSAIEMTKIGLTLNPYQKAKKDISFVGKIADLYDEEDLK
jgi:hypothetical protein